MVPRIVLYLGLFILLTPPRAIQAEGKGKEEDLIRTAVEKSLPLLRKGAAGHRENRTCFACHNQGIPLLALTTARSRGFSVDEEDLKKHLGFIGTFLGKNREGYRKGRGQGGQVDTAGYALWSLDMGGWKGDANTAAVAEYLLLYQKDLPTWKVSANRPPSEISPFTSSYLGLRALRTYGTPEQQERIEEKTKKVLAWLRKTPPKDTEDRVFRLWALKVAGVEKEELQDEAAVLMKTQRPDGGWGQTESMAPDAYATGTALAVLHEAGGIEPSHPAYRNGLKYLLSTQLSDGSWHVRSRSKPFQAYFETGFPHGKDQFISIAASAWATTALAFSFPPHHGGGKK